MSRINFEDRLFVDPRYKKLCSIIGEVQANGWLVILWRFAQEYYKNGKLFIPSVAYRYGGFPEELIKCEFVLETPEGFYVKGTKRNFDWLQKRRKAAEAGGSASVKSRKKLYGNAIPLGASNQTKTEACASEKPKQTEPSSSSSFSLEHIHTTCVDPLAKKKGIKTNDVMFYFKQAYLNYVGKKYYVNSYPKDMKLIKNILSQKTYETTIKLIDLFFQSNDKFIKSSTMDIGVFSSQINKLQAALQKED